ncbi:MAG TPA: putative lipid II flippase FtsW [Polyangiaceae bacterium]|nr:putative lipid II flippase FtsW [Polyangiaceae bacterium]
MAAADKSLPKNRPIEKVAPLPDKKVLPQPIAELLQSSPDGPVDSVLAAVVIALVGFGVVMVYSSSAVEATTRYHDAEFFLKRQGLWALGALIAMWIASRIDYRRIRTFTYPILGTVGVMLLLTIVGFGHRAGNANRWLAIGPIHIQPSELAKLAVVMWLSYSLSKKADQIKSFSVGFLPHLFVSGVFMLLCLKQPDFGSAVVLLFLTFTMLFVAGARIPYIAAFTMLMGLGAAAAVRLSNYRYARYVAWIDMDAHRDGMSYQPFQSVMSFGSGGTWGLGLGRGLQVLYLPEAHTDFISAIIGEELGFIGILGLAAVYLAVVARGVKIALNAADDYGSFLAFGISTLFGVQALTNLCVAMAILPTKGLTLPFVSYGGSSLLVNAMAIGVLLSISRPRRKLASKTKDKPAPEPKKDEAPLPSATGVVLSSADEGAAGW